MLKLVRKVLLSTICAFSFHPIAYAECEHSEELIVAIRGGYLSVLHVAAQYTSLHKFCDRSRGGISLLHIAAETVHEDILNYLLKHGFDVNNNNNDEALPPLYFAHLETTKTLLVNRGAKGDFLKPEIRSLLKRRKSLSDDERFTKYVFENTKYVMPDDDL